MRSRRLDQGDAATEIGGSNSTLDERKRRNNPPMLEETNSERIHYNCA